MSKLVKVHKVSPKVKSESVLNEPNKLSKVGTHVILYSASKSISDLASTRLINIKHGVITKKYKLDEDYSYHGSPWYPEVIEVQCDDGSIYKDFFDSHLYSIISVDYLKQYLDEYLKTTEDTISHNLNLLESYILKTTNEPKCDKSESTEVRVSDFSDIPAGYTGDFILDLGNGAQEGWFVCGDGSVFKDRG